MRPPPPEDGSLVMAEQDQRLPRRHELRRADLAPGVVPIGKIGGARIELADLPPELGHDQRITAARNGDVEGELAHRAHTTLHAPISTRRARPTASAAAHPRSESRRATARPSARPPPPVRASGRQGGSSGTPGHGRGPRRSCGSATADAAGRTQTPRRAARPRTTGRTRRHDPQAGLRDLLPPRLVLRVLHDDDPARVRVRERLLGPARLRVAVDRERHVVAPLVRQQLLLREQCHVATVETGTLMHGILRRGRGCSASSQRGPYV
jgi:hypothetical protein